MTYEKVSKNLSSIIRITKPKAMEVPIHTICMPERAPRLKISLSP